MAKLYNLAAMTVASTGTGTITLGSAATISGVLYLSFAAAGVSNGETVAYSINDVGGSEVGTGVYTAAGTTLTRSPITSTNANAAINMTSAAIVKISPAKADLANLREYNTFTDQNFVSGGNQTITVPSYFVSFAMNASFTVQRNITNLTGGNYYGQAIDVQFDNSNASQNAAGFLTFLTTPSTNSTNHGTLAAWFAQLIHGGTGTVATIQGMVAAVFNQGIGAAVTTMIAGAFTTSNSGSGASVSAAKAIAIAVPIGGSGASASTWTNTYGIDIADQKPSGTNNTLTNPPIGILIESQTATGAFAIKQSGLGLNWFEGPTTIAAATATPAAGSTTARLLFGTTAGFGIYYGSGAPTVSAAQGSIYLRSDGSSTSTRLYVNTNGSTTWTNFTSAT